MRRTSQKTVLRAVRPAILAFAALLAACGGSPTTTTGTLENEAGKPVEQLKTVAVEVQEQESASSLFAKASAAYQAGNMNEAYSFLLATVDRDPKLAEAWYNLGVLSESRGDWAKAEEYYNKSADVGSEFGEGLAAIGTHYLKMGDEQMAKGYYDRALKIQPLTSGANLNNALFARGDKDFPKAVTLIREALKGDSQNDQAYEVLAKVYYDMGHYDLAQLVCKSGLHFNPKSAPLHNMLGLILLHDEKVPQALQAFDDAIASDPNFVPAQMNAGSLAFGYRDYEFAYNAFGVVLENEPKNIDAILSRAVAARALEKYDEAEKGYRAVLALDPQNLGAHFNLGLLYQEFLSKPDVAILSYQEALAAPGLTDKMRKTLKERIEISQLQVEDMAQDAAMRAAAEAENQSSGGEEPQGEPEM